MLEPEDNKSRNMCDALQYLCITQTYKLCFSFFKNSGIKGKLI